MLDPSSVVAVVLVHCGLSVVFPIKGAIEPALEKPEGSAVGASNVASSVCGAIADWLVVAMIFARRFGMSREIARLKKFCPM